MRTNIRTYHDSFQGIGCRTGCLVHLALMGVLAVAALICAIKYRAWELSVTVEMPAKKREGAEPKVREVEGGGEAPKEEPGGMTKPEPNEVRQTTVGSPKG